MQQATPFLPDVLLKVKQIVGDPKAGITPLVPVSRCGWFAGVKSGKFPQPDVRLGARTVCWRLSTIQTVIDGTWSKGGAK